MAKTYEPIATQVLGVAGGFDMSSIPATFTDLVVVVNLPSVSGAGSIYFRVNGDGSDLYNCTILSGNGSAVACSMSGSYTLATIAPSPLTTATNIVMHFQNYASVSENKVMLTRFSQVGYRTSLGVNMWRSTAAINRIVLSTTSGSFPIGSTMTIYGILRAG